MKNITVVEHPLIAHSLTIIRDKDTTTEEFRRHGDIVSKVLLMEATKHIKLKDKNVETPLAPFAGKRLSDEIIVVPVLRAGLAMLFSLRDFLPAVSVGFIGLERDEQTAIAREYYNKIPKVFATHIVFVIDPMLATGGSMDDTLKAVKGKGAKRIVAVSIVSAPEGITRVQKNHPDVPIITAAVDSHLNDRAYIVPGLGDFGDRYFGT
ncbi:MAG: Uracil phosphoribosyltransferase [Candidatus Gottesmanbacteria bacterium GW2011_GWA2_47_9]|uniref:Uracil phosphoribosyltransferase n=2 Tax=Candidatus Gottesmaniibacteriota TaxID=1752720 RepID=A0A0G1WAV3_9BACT|nr:MAG: Uracil phosphoribosyltransferase [Candidatus Gottesmanbacteria bacterium GW2011_GWA2_47_9]